MIHTFHATVWAFAFLSMLFLSIYGIYHPRVNDGLIGRALYMCIAILCIGGLAHIDSAVVPRNIVSGLILSMAALLAREVVRERYGQVARSHWFMMVKDSRAKNAKVKR